jgi:hypothetical protein
MKTAEIKALQWSKPNPDRCMVVTEHLLRFMPARLSALPRKLHSRWPKSALETSMYVLQNTSSGKRESEAAEQEVMLHEGIPIYELCMLDAADGCGTLELGSRSTPRTSCRWKDRRACAGEPGSLELHRDNVMDRITSLSATSIAYVTLATTL